MAKKLNQVSVNHDTTMNKTEIRDIELENVNPIDTTYTSFDGSIMNTLNNALFKLQSILQKYIFSNKLLIIFFTIFILTIYINYKEIVKSYDKVILSDFKDLLYWSKFTISSVGIVYFCLYLVGVDLKNALKENNLSVTIFAIAMLIITSYFGLKLYS